MFETFAPMLRDMVHVWSIVSILGPDLVSAPTPFWVVRILRIAFVMRDRGPLGLKSCPVHAFMSFISGCDYEVH